MPLGASEEVPSPNIARNLDFVDRQRRMGGLLSAIDDVKSGRGLLVMLASEPGIGKTRIVQKLGAIAEKRDAQMLWGRCYEGEGAPP